MTSAMLACGLEQPWETPMTFTYHDEETAPDASKPLMERSRKGFGMLPNLHKILAAAPITYRAYVDSFEAFMNESSFSKLEAQIVFMTANYENDCHYCTAGHSWAMAAAKMPADVIEALREGQPLSDPKLEALRSFARDLLTHRGHIGDARLQAFLDAGYTKAQALEVLCGLSAKLISNFTNALAHTELDPPMNDFAWTHPSKR